MDLMEGMSISDTQKLKLIKPEALIFQPVLSLFQLSSVKIITHVWSQPNILNEVQKITIELESIINNIGDEKWKNFFKQVSSLESWSTIVNSVHERITFSQIPKSFHFGLQRINENISTSLLTWVAHLFCILRSTSTTSRSLHLDQIVWNQYGKINEEQSARALLTLEEFANDDKLLIACHYCLEDQVRKLTSGSPLPNHLVNESVVRSLDTHGRMPKCADYWHPQVQKWPIVIYWNAVFSDKSILHRELLSYNMRENTPVTLEYFVLTECTSPHHTRNAAFRYLWSKLNSEDKMYAACYIMSFTYDIELAFYALNNLPLNDRLQVLAKCCISWLRFWMIHPLWQSEFFSAMNFYSDVMSGADFEILSLHAVLLMGKGPSKSKFYYNIFKGMWYNIPERFANETFSRVECMAQVLNRIPWKEDLNFVRYLLSKINDDKRRDIIYSVDGYERCAQFIEEEELELFDLYTSSMLKTKESLFEFKRMLLKNRDLEFANLASCLIDGHGWQQEREFFEWYFNAENNAGPESKKQLIDDLMLADNLKLLGHYIDYSFPPHLLEQRNEFKRMLFKTNGFIFAEKFMNDNKQSHEDFLRWFFQHEDKNDETNKKLVDNFLASILLGYPGEIDPTILTYFLNWSVEPTRDLHDTLKDPQYIGVLSRTMKHFALDWCLDIADQLLEWYFAEDMDSVIEFKRQLLLNHNYNWATFVLFLLKTGEPDRMVKLRKFVHWAFPKGDDKEFKHFLSNSNIWWKLLIPSNFALADDFLNFCFDSSSTKIRKFKNDAFLGRKFKLVLNSCIDCRNEYKVEKLKDVFLWFNPDVEAINFFKSVYSDSKFAPVNDLLTELFPSC